MILFDTVMVSLVGFRRRFRNQEEGKFLIVNAESKVALAFGLESVY